MAKGLEKTRAAIQTVSSGAQQRETEMMRKLEGRHAAAEEVALKHWSHIRNVEELCRTKADRDMVQKGLSDYLETKRGVFARFYFLSDDDLLSILSESKNVKLVQPHFKKCFEAIDKVQFEEDLTITNMFSPEKEMVPFSIPIDPTTSSVEVWMLALEKMMLGRTSIVVAHRFSTIVSCDQIAVILKGRLVDVAPHAELYERCETYQKLVEGQELA